MGLLLPKLLLQRNPNPILIPSLLLLLTLLRSLLLLPKLLLQRNPNPILIPSPLLIPNLLQLLLPLLLLLHLLKPQEVVGFQQEILLREPNCSRQSVPSAIPVSQVVVPSKAQPFRGSLEGQQVPLVTISRVLSRILRLFGAMNTCSNSCLHPRSTFQARRWFLLVSRKKVNGQISSLLLNQSSRCSNNV